MSPGHVALGFILGIVAIGSIVGFYAGARYKMDLEEWAVAGRGFGLILVWLLTAGEVYTTFALLGASGWAYSRGGPSLYIIAYLPLANVVAFYFVPQLWELGRAYKLQTQPDFFERRYSSKYLAAFVSIVGFVAIVPYVQLQLTGFGIIVNLASFGAISRTAATAIAAVVITAFVLVSGIRAVAWVSVLKDFLLLAAVVSIGIGLPWHYFHGIGAMFTALLQAHPDHMRMPGATTNLGHGWFISTVLLNALGGYMWPQLFAAAFTAKSGDVLRKNAVFLPLYSITLPFILFAGFTALMIVPGLANGDLSLLTLARRTFPPWWLGAIGGAGALTAMVPAAIFSLAGATLFAKNFIRPLAAPRMSGAGLARTAKCMVVVVMGLAFYFALHSSATLVNLLLWGYDAVAQLFPGFIFGIFWKRVTSRGVWSGMLAGIALFVWLVSYKTDPFHGLNAGFLALCLNFATAAAVSLLTAPQRSGFEDALEAAAGD